MEVVVLDIDDTLYLERDYARSGFRAVEAAAAIPGFADTAWQLFLDGVRGDTFDRALAALDQPPEPGRVAELVAIYREHEPAIALTPDAASFLAAAQAAGRPLAAVTDGPLASQRAKARALDLAAVCGTVVFTAELGPGLGKPHPRAFEAVQELTARPHAAHLYLADNPVKDFGGPRSLGWATVRVRRAGSLHEAVDTPDEVDLEVADLSGLAALLGLTST